MFRRNKPDEEYEMMPVNPEEIIYEPSTKYQLRALSRSATTLLSRQKLLMFSCVFACPLITMIIAGVLCLTIGNMIKDAPSSNTMFCSDDPLRNSVGIPLDFDPIKKPPSMQKLNNAGFYIIDWTSTLATRYHCVHWFGDRYPYKEPYSPDPQLSNAEQDTTFLPKPVGGWWNLQSSLGKAPRTELQPLDMEIPQKSPWFMYQEMSQGMAGSKPQPEGNSSVAGSGFLGEVPTRFFRVDSNNLRAVPYFEKTDNLRSALAKKYELTLDYLSRNSNVDAKFPYPPFGGIKFNEISGNKLSFTLLYGALKNLLTDQRILKIYPRQGFSQLVTISQMTTAYAKIRFQNSIKITQGIRAFPRKVNPVEVIDVTGVIGPIFYPFTLSFLLPILVMKLVREKEDRIFMMMKMHGMKWLPHFVVNYIQFYLLQVASALTFVIVGLLFKMTFFTRTSPVIVAGILLLWCHAQTAMTFFFSQFFSKGKKAIIVMYLFVIISLMLNLIADSIFSNGISLLWFIHPSLAFYYGLQLISAHASMTNGLEPLTVFDIVSGEIGIIFLSLIISSTVLFLIWFTVSQAKLHQKLSFFRKTTLKEELLSEEEDEDVKNEASLSAETRPSRDFPLVLRNLKKTYRNGKNALKGISIVIEKNTIFGLLGPNGAGKSTLIHILTGLIEKTSGQAFVAGRNISTNIQDIQLRIGVCPQHDILWRSKTAEEHALFYCRLRGVPPAQEKTATRQCLSMVGLTYARNTLAKHLSGGEKRRLSLCIAMLGNNQLLFLDEPTTGVDAEARKAIWKIITKAQEKSTIVLTTHSMEEAEALSDKIAMVTKGNIWCVGTSSHLKEKFGSDITLTITPHESIKWKELEDCLPPFEKEENPFSNEIYLTFNAKSLQKDFMQNIRRNHYRWGIASFSITQNTLEDVFIRMVEESEDPLTYNMED